MLPTLKDGLIVTEGFGEKMSIWQDGQGVPILFAQSAEPLPPKDTQYVLNVEKRKLSSDRKPRHENSGMEKGHYIQKRLINIFSARMN